jgi:hypothetical protein
MNPGFEDGRVLISVMISRRWKLGRMKKTRLRRLLENSPTSTVLLDTFGHTESTPIWNSPSFRATCFFYEGRDCELSKRSLKNFMVTIGWRSCWSPLQNAHICTFHPLYNRTRSVEVLSRQRIEQHRIIAVTLKWSRKGVIVNTYCEKVFLSFSFSLHALLSIRMTDTSLQQEIRTSEKMSSSLVIIPWL